MYFLVAALAVGLLAAVVIFVTFGVIWLIVSLVALGFLILAPTFLPAFIKAWRRERAL